MEEEEKYQHVKKWVALVVLDKMFQHPELEKVWRDASRKHVQSRPLWKAPLEQPTTPPG